MKAVDSVLITGVAGFIGSNLLDYLLDRTDWQITGVDDLSTGNTDNVSHRLKEPRFRFENKPVTALDTVRPYKYIFHLAALPRIQPSFDFVTEHISANLTSSMHLVDLMIRDSCFPRFIFSSSSAIYGTPRNVPTSEDEPVDCLSPYAFQKYEVEKYLELLSTRHPLDYVNLRYFNPYGPRSYNPDNKFNAYSSVVGIFLNRRASGQPLLVTGDGSQRRDFIHVQDLASANYLAAIHTGRLNTSFNIGYGSTLSVLELAKLISDNYQFIARREGESEITFAETKKARNILGWQPTCRLEEYIKQSL